MLAEVERVFKTVQEVKERVKLAEEDNVKEEAVLTRYTHLVLYILLIKSMLKIIRHISRLWNRTNSTEYRQRQLLI